MTDVGSVAEAALVVGLDPEQRVAQLPGTDVDAFRRLVGFDAGGPVVDGPTEAERKARASREAWKVSRLDRDRSQPRLVIDAEALERARRHLANGTAPDWLVRLQSTAHHVAALGIERLCALIPEQAPWNAAGSFCPNCLGDRSDVAIHAPFWTWHVDSPEQITCPHCGITYPHDDFPEHGRLDLPRLGLSYSFYLTAEQRAQSDWRDGVHASRFGGGPTHVSLSGEASRCALNWVLGQLEPMALAAAIEQSAELTGTVQALLLRLAQVYERYPLYTYRQEYYDCEPAYAVAHCNSLPAVLRRAACWYTYDGRLGEAVALHGRGDNTVGQCHYPNAEWGCSRLAREKASHGQLFLSLLHAWDLTAASCNADDAVCIERDLLLEYYLDVKGLTTRIDNKSGPGTAAHVVAGLMWDDEADVEEGVRRFHHLLEGQFHGDGSWKETPIYGAKALVENLWEVPELLRRRGLYDDALLRNAFSLYADTATPCGTLPALDDSAADFSLPAHLRDLANLRLGLHIPAADDPLLAFGPARSGRIGFGGYVPRLDMVPDDETRLPGDGGVGFGAVGHLTRQAPTTSWVDALLGSGPASTTPRVATSRFLRGRGLLCLGLGSGPNATQLYVDGGDGRRGHRHQAPLALMGFHGGHEVFPDIGYIADHPANAWIRSTASHSTVLLDGQSVEAMERCRLLGFEPGDEQAFADVEVTVGVRDTQRQARYRRALVLLQNESDSCLLVDVFDAAGDGPFDYVCRAGLPGAEAQLSVELGDTPRDDLFADEWATPPSRVLSAGAASSVQISWPGQVPVAAHLVRDSAELVSFQSPAWRNAHDVCAAPDLCWTSILSRQVGPRARFVTVYALGRAAPPDVIEHEPDVSGVVRLTVCSTSRWHITIDQGSFSAERA